MSASHRLDELARAKMLLALCGLFWGVNWPLIKIGLTGLTPFNYRLIAFLYGAGGLIVIVKLTRRSLAVPFGMTWVHLFVSSLLNVVAFGVFSTFALLTATTPRVAVVSYTFPVWTCLLAWLILGERLRGGAAIGLTLCVGGLAVLLYPVLETSAVIGIALSIASAVSWAAGTIYLKLVRIPLDMMVSTAWQFAIAAVVVLICSTLVQGWPTFEPVPNAALAAAVFNGVNTVIAYLIWYHIIGRLPATTASLGSLASPVIGVAASALFLAEYPSLIDMTGFALIFAAAACAILQRQDRPVIAPSPNPETRP